MQCEDTVATLRNKRNTHMEDFITPLFDLLNEMTPYLLLGFFIAGLLHEFVPRRIYADKLSGNNLKSVLWAAAFGIPLPLCSCGVIPTATSLYREGASRGATVSFLISTPQTGVDSIVATASLLGLPFAILRPFVALITAIIGGCTINRLYKEEHINNTAEESKNEKKSFLQKCIGTLHYGFIHMLQDIGQWIVIGLVVAAIITVAVPDNFFTQLNDYPIINMMLVLLISAPMYLCATGSIPIAAALMLKGLSPGAALVLLMAGPATNVAAMLVINKVLGRKTFITYLLTIIGGAIGFGLFVDYLLPAEWFTGSLHGYSTGCCHSEGTPWWQIASTIIFVVLLAVAYILRATHKGKCCETKTHQRKFKINGMMCNHCKSNVENSLSKIEGVTSVRVDLAEGAAYVEGDGVESSAIITVIRDLGYEYIEE